MLLFILRSLKFLFNTAFFLLLIGGIGGFTLVQYYSKDLPDYRQLAEYNPPTVTRLYAGDGKLLEEYAIEHRIFVPINAIPKLLINAFLAAEDKNFYQHAGVDPTTIFRAMIHNLYNIINHKSLVGGSTITQQVVKNFLLTNEKSIYRKIKEAILSYRITQAYSKDRILELYLNQIYLGARSYGVASAAVNYFNKSIDELSIEEAAFIAALPKAPSNYFPKAHYERAKARRDWVIARMLEEGFISEQEAKEAAVKPIVLRSRDRTEIVKADFFAESVRKEISNTYGNKVLYEGGLTVHTTLDPRLQEIAYRTFRQGLVNYDRRHGYRGPIAHFDNLQDWPEQLRKMNGKETDNFPRAVILEIQKDKLIIGLLEEEKPATLPLKELSWAKPNIQHPKELYKTGDVIEVEKDSKKSFYHLKQTPKVNGGLVALDPHTGRVLALVGGYSYNQSEFNRAMQAKRQAGSTFKPFIYLAALERGFSPSHIIVDGPIELNQGAGLPTWKPKNYSRDFLGPTTLRRGLEKSRNTMTVRLAQFLGIKKVIEVTKRFGISDNPPRNFALALGAVETTLLNLTNAYGMIVNGGKRIAPSLIERIQDVNGKTIYKRDKRECEGCLINSTTDVFAIIAPDIEDNRETVTDPRTAYQMVSILQGVVQRGTAASALKLNRTLGGKTGTTNESNDLWFVGFSPDLVVGTFIGYDTPKSLGEKETGATWALPIFIEFMAEALKNTPDIPFRIPPGIKQIKVNAITGKPTDAPLARDVIIESFKSGTEPVPEQATPFAPASPASEPSIFDSFDNFLRESTPSGIY